MRKRIRPAYSEEELQQLYGGPPLDYMSLPDHRWRIEATVALAKWFTFESIADLSAGRGDIMAHLWARQRYRGDISNTRRIEETIHEIPPVDLFICTETLEHLDDPDAVLREIRKKTRYLVASTPVGDWPDDPGHYWAWDVEGFGEMLEEAGFKKVVRCTLEQPPPYSWTIQIWGCE